MKTYFKGPRPGETEVQVKCPVCKTEKVRQFWRLENYSFQKCVYCGHVYQNPRPLSKDLEERYDEDYKQYEVVNADNFFNLMQLGLEDVGFSKLEENLGNNKKFLDIGCATGKLVKHLKDRGWESMGIEICKASASYGRDKLGIEILEGTLESLKLPENSFDLVHSSHVIEHVPDPDVYLEEIHKITKPGGYCICVTPNIKSFQANFYREEWRSAIADHVHLFSLDTLKRLMESKGFKILKTGTWGGIPKGEAPEILKKIMDKMAKKFGFGDVMIILAKTEKA